MPYQQEREANPVIQGLWPLLSETTEFQAWSVKTSSRCVWTGDAQILLYSDPFIYQFHYLGMEAGGNCVPMAEGSRRVKCQDQQCKSKADVC